MKLGNGLWQYREFNSRLQATEIRLWNGSTNLLAFNYGYGSANNSGNVLSQQIAMPGLSLTQNYAYDTLHRLETASETGSWSQTYGYDLYGNRWVASGAEYGNDPALTPTAQSDFDASTNRLAGATYDAAGNLTVDAAGRTFDYDAENRQIAFEGGLAQYFYDGEGRRVKKQAGAEVTIYVYNILGQLIAEYGTAANPESGPKYLTVDHLGSTCEVTDQTGGVLSHYDYLPFGEEIAGANGDRNTVTGYGSADTLNHKFTGKERDAETGLDYFGARYYGNHYGRFTSVDPVHGQPMAPQTWNNYAYVLNDPLKYVDPDGKCAVPAGLVEGQVGICIESFIAAPRIGIVGFGDNRDFEPNDPDATFRTTLRMVIDPQTGEVVDSDQQPGVSEVGLRSPMFGVPGTTSVSGGISPAGDGKHNLSLFIRGSNGLAALNNLGDINILVNLRIDGQGNVKLDPSTSRTKAFPSIEGYAYRIVQGATLIDVLFKVPEKDPSALNGPMDRPLLLE